jgi:long-subunit acyl-CoA synthetase (AMP-forming)
MKYMGLGLVPLGVQKGDRIFLISETYPEITCCRLNNVISDDIRAFIYQHSR